MEPGHKTDDLLPIEINLKEERELLYHYNECQFKWVKTTKEPLSSPTRFSPKPNKKNSSQELCPELAIKGVDGC